MAEVLIARRWRLGVSMEGPEFFVASGNITTARVDAIVASAVSTLTRGEAVIVKTGGGRIISVCRRWLRRHARLKVGQAMATRADKLPCAYVIQVLGPRGQCGRSTQPKLAEAHKVRTVIRNALREADRLQLASIAIPGISCGVCEYSKELATKDIVDECVSYTCEHADTTTLKTILFVSTDVATHHGFVNALWATAASLWRHEMPVQVREQPFIDQNDALSARIGELDLTSPRSSTLTLFEQLACDDPYYRRVLKELPDGILCKVVSIRRVRVSAHHQEYEKLKELLVDAAEVDDLYHGTPHRWRATAIALGGFDLSIRLSGRSYGDGVYASNDVNMAFTYTCGKGSLVKLRGLVASQHDWAGRNVQERMHLFPNPKALLPVTIIDFEADDEEDRAVLHKALCQL